MTAISIRRAECTDAPIVAAFVHALLAELSGGSPPALTDVTRHAEAVLSGGNVIAVIAYGDTLPIGVMTLNECAAIYAGGKFGEISELYISPEMRSQGIAKQLLDRAKIEALARGWKRIEVGAPGQPEWQRTLAFYLRNGFVEIGPRLRCLI